VIGRFPLEKNAIPFFWIGIAFFMLSCQPRPPLHRPPEVDSGQALFSAAEAERAAGNRRKALEGYSEYVERNPGGPRAVEALKRMAGMLEEESDFESAISLYERILQDYPDHSGANRVSLDLANLLYRVGRYGESKDEALRFVRRFPSDPLAGSAFLVLGKSANALGEQVEAFSWFLRASSTLPQEGALRREVDEGIANLVQNADMVLLGQMVEPASGTGYLPLIYDRMAGLALETGDLEGARDAAMALVRSTPDQHWVDRGRIVLDKISEELAVRRGVLGCLLPLSGPFAIYGQEVLNGIQLGIGAFGASEEEQDLKLLIEDTQGKPDVAIAKVEDLAQKGVMGIIGPLASRTAAAGAQKAQELGVPMITLTQREGITETGDVVFRNFLTPAREMDLLVSKAVEEMGIVRFGILYPDSPYGLHMLNLFWDRAEKAGASITAVESYRPDAVDFAEEIKKMVGLYYPRPPSIAEKRKHARPAAPDAGVEPGSYDELNEPEPIVDFDAVFIPDSSQKVALIAPQFPFHNVFNVRLLGTSLWQSPELLEQGADYLQGAIFPSGFFPQSAEDFVNLYKENFGTDPGILAATGYDTIRLVNRLVKEQTIRTRRDLRQALLLSGDFQGVRGALSFDDKREATTSPILLTIKGKQFVSVE